MPANHSPTNSPTGGRILLADDEESIRDGVRQVLGRQGYEVTCAEDGPRALELMAQGGFDLVLLDLRMPGLDGMEVLRRLRKEHPQTEVIILTGHGTIELAVQAMKLGATDFITKPFVPWHLKQVVGRVMEHRRLQAERDRLAQEARQGLWAITTEKSRLRAVINSMSEGVLITGPELAVLLCNPALGALMGLEESGLVGTPLKDHPRLAELAAMGERLLAGPEELRGITQELELGGEPPRFLRASASRVATEGEILGVVWVLEDVTPQKEMERKKNDFVAMLAHELKAPLSVVDTQLNVMLRGLAGELSDKQRGLFLRMKERVGAVVEMIGDLLELARREDAGFVQEKQLLDLTPVLREAAEMLEPRAREQWLDFYLELAPELPPVLADPASLKDVAVNLISNAIRYTPEGGSITVRSGSEGGHVFFEVQDTGFGIPPEDQDRIFDRFYRVKSERTRHIAGTGLGLPIVKAIVEDHRGTVEVSSEPDRGSTFRVRLPVQV